MGLRKRRSEVVKKEVGVFEFFGKEISRSEVKGVGSLFFRCY